MIKITMNRNKGKYKGFFCVKEQLNVLGAFFNGANQIVRNILVNHFDN